MSKRLSMIGAFFLLVFFGGVAQADQGTPTGSYIEQDGAAAVFSPVSTPEPKEMVVKVKAKKQLLKKTQSVSSTEVNKEQIESLPQGSEISLPELITSTTPGAVAGPFGQMFIRGNHADVQYQIDGVQMPDSPSNTFGEAFSPRNIDHMEVITGGIPAEYGDRLGAVVNIVTKSGPIEPGGEIELNYGSYDTFSPHLLYGGSNKTGDVHYFVSANYMQTSRGLDTPQPLNTNDRTLGGMDAIHDQATGNNEFAKIDWLIDNDNKLSFVFSNSEDQYQIPNFPSSFGPTDPIFTQPDQWGNAPQTYVPSYTNDVQTEADVFAQAVWKHTISDHSFFQLAPYYKYSFIHFQNDPINDLASGAGSASFYENRNIGNLGLKGDYSNRWNNQNLFKAGFFYEYSRSDGMISVQKDSISNAPSMDKNADTGQFEGLYAQDDWTISKRWSLNGGLRFDATQFAFADATPDDWMIQPRIGVSYMATDTTKLHAFYGKLFQPAPVEDLRDTFIAAGVGQVLPYDIKAEKDDYYEVGVAQQFLQTQVAMVNVYYKDATNMLDDAQLLNTVIAQPYNFAKGFAYGAEFTVKGDINDNWSEYFNYSYEVSKGSGISGGFFTLPAGTLNSTAWRFLDHCQLHTANAGLSYRRDRYSWTVQALYGSGLRTDPNNGSTLPEHLTFDTTAGYEFRGSAWYSRFKLSADVLNITNDVYPISIANGFNGSHYAVGREFFLRIVKDL